MLDVRFHELGSGSRLSAVAVPTGGRGCVLRPRACSMGHNSSGRRRYRSIRVMAATTTMPRNAATALVIATVCVSSRDATSSTAERRMLRSSDWMFAASSYAVECRAFVGYSAR